jgi:hypothetical protein
MNMRIAMVEHTLSTVSTKMFLGRLVCMDIV